MIYKEKVVESNTMFEGRIIKVLYNKVELPDKQISTREIVMHPGGAGIVAVTENQEIILVKQYRSPLDDVIYEIPAGKLDGGEDHRVCALRELKEETGMTADVFEYMGFIYPSPGFTDEKTYVYYAEGLKAGEAEPDEDEFLDVIKVPLKKAYDMVMSGEINDAKSVFGILKYVNIKNLF